MRQELEISLYQDAENLSAQQKKFNRLLKKLEQQNTLLNEWKAAQQDIQHKARQELLPKYAKLHQILFQQLENLWAHKAQSKFTARQKILLDGMIKNLAEQLLNVDSLSEEQYQDVEHIFEYFHKRQTRKNSVYHEDNVEIQKENLKSVIHEELGIEADFIDFEFDPNDIEDFMDKLNQKIAAQEEQDFLNQCTEEDRREFEKQQQREHAKEKKQQEKRELAQKMASQSLKSIYAKIAAVIHPDRESDEQKKIEKTELLQITNQAYENKDLFTLLKLQMQYVTSKKQSTKEFDEQLKYYNISLQDQIERIEMQIFEIVHTFDWRRHSFSTHKIQVKDLYKKYKSDLHEIQKNIEQAEFIFKHSQDSENLKVMIKKGYL